MSFQVEYNSFAKSGFSVFLEESDVSVTTQTLDEPSQVCVTVTLSGSRVSFYGEPTKLQGMFRECLTQVSRIKPVKVQPSQDIFVEEDETPVKIDPCPMCEAGIINHTCPTE